jgi:hypothetical protein
MKTIFLDIDGVLNNTATYIYNRQQSPSKKYIGYSHRHMDEVDPRLLGLVRYIVDETGAKIVISSSWRIIHTQNEIAQVFAYNGWLDAPIIDMTPKSMDAFRGNEIRAWLDNDEYTTKYAILDDGTDFYEHQPLFRTDATVGLTFIIAQKVIEFLNN